MKNMKKYWPTIRDYLLILIATFIQALALRLFFVPAELASGGVSGISQLINHYTGWPIGLMIFLGNIPLFLVGWRFLGGYRFAARTAFAVFMYSAFTDLLVQTPLFAPGGAATRLINDLQGDIFLNALYGAIVSGVGYGLVYRARGTSGGSDILARILSHYRGVPVTQSYLLVDTAVILAAGYSAVVSWSLTVGLRPIYSLLLTAVLMTAFLALSGWRSYVERERYMRSLRPFVASQHLYPSILEPAGASLPAASRSRSPAHLSRTGF